MKSNLVILIVSDEQYFKHLTALIASIKINFSEASIWCHLINPSSIHNHLLKRKDLLFSTEKKHFRDDASKRGYCANIRCQVMAKIFKLGYKYVLYVDADSIIRQDCSNLKNIITKKDITICKRDYEKKVNLKFATGIIGIQNNATTRLFLKKWIEEINKTGIYNWFSDQIGFARVYQVMKNDLNFLSLPETYRDWNFKKNTHIWTGKGERKLNNRLYILEEKFYQKAFSQTPNIGDKIKLSIQQLFWRTVYFISTLPKKIHYKLIHSSSKKNK